MYSKYASKDLEILAFPCNQFMSQEPGTEAEIKEFVKQYGVNFPMFSKVLVNGADCHPLFAYLRQNSSLKNNEGASEIPWNFGKFLLDKDGKVKKFFGPKEHPMAMEEDIQNLLE